MGKKPVITAAEAALLVKDNDVVTTNGFVGSCLPEALTKALEKRFLETGSPKNLTLFYAAGQGNRDGSGADHFAHEGMIKRVIGGHWNLAPNLGKMAIENKIEAYNLPQGVLSQLYRDVAAHRVGTITHVGLNTFADPRIEGGKLNSVTKEDILEVITIAGQERLLYKPQSFNVGFIRGTFADENGNVTLEREVCPAESTALAQAVKNNGGKVIVQVERVVASGTLDPRVVKVPGIYVDAIVVTEDKVDHNMSVGFPYDGAISGDLRVPLGSLKFPPLDSKKVIGRRAAMELEPNTIVNLGIGIPEYISMVASEEGIGDYFTLTVEAGPIGGVPQGGSRFGGSVNPEAILDQPSQFDFYDGGGLDLAFLGLAQGDEEGNINVSKFGPRIAGCGGFVNITQNAKKVFFCGTFTADGLKTVIADGKLTVAQEGKERKFLKKVEQITFSGKYAVKNSQPVLYITERAVFQLRNDGVYLIEVAPGVDVKTQVLDLMDFTPKMDGAPKLMDARIFKNELMGLKKG
jgi:propionate CoA-transferase